MLKLLQSSLAYEQDFCKLMKTMNKVYLTLLLSILLMAQKVYAGELKFVQITDSHFSVSASNATQRDVEHSKSYLESTISDINTLNDVDFVVFTGDNIDQANSDDLKVFLKMANKLKFPYYILIGNHEVFKNQHFTKKDYMGVVRRYSKNCRPKSVNYVFKKKGFVFIVVDGAKEVIPGPAGYYKKETLQWLDKKLTKYKCDNVIILQHFPIEAPYYNRTHTTYKVEEYQAVLNKHSNVIAIVSGHYHGNGEKMVDGIYHISTPALVEPPHNYKIIEVETQQGTKPLIYTQLRNADEK